VHAGGLGAALAYCEQNPTPELLILETAQENSDLLKRIDQLADVCDPATRLVVIGHSNDVALYRTLLRRGVSDYLVSPFSREAVVETVQNLFSGEDGGALARVIGFFGARGGVGSTTVACNTAWALANTLSQQVALVDLDMAFGTVALAFNVDARQGIDNALADGDRLDDELLDRYMPKYDDNLSLLVSPASLDANATVDPAALSKVLDRVRRSAQFVLLDLPHVWAPWTRDLLSDADEVVITVAPDLAALRNAKRLVEHLRQAGGPDRSVRLVLNQVGGAKKTQLTVKDVKDGVGLEPAIVLPFEPGVFGVAANNGQMAGEVQKNGRIAGAFGALAQSVSGRAPVKREKRRFFWMKRGET
jgi:pilus assembly protein CpaE